MDERAFSPDVCHSSEADSCGNKQAEWDDCIQPLDLSMKSSTMHTSEVRLCSGTVTQVLGQAMGRADSGALVKSSSQRKQLKMWNANPVLWSPSRKKSKDSIPMREINAVKLQHGRKFSPDLNISGRTNPVLLPQTQNNNVSLISEAEFDPRVTLLNKVLAQHLPSDRENSLLANPSSQVIGLHPDRNVSLDFNASGSTNRVLQSQTQSSSISEADIDPNVALISMVLAKLLPKDTDNSLQGNPQNPSYQVMGKPNAEGLQHSRNMPLDLNVPGRTNAMLQSQTQSFSPVSEADIAPHVTLLNMVLPQHLPRDRENSLQGNSQNHPFQMTPSKCCFENQPFRGQNYQHDLSEMGMNIPPYPSTNPIPSDIYAESSVSVTRNINRDLFYATISRINLYGFDAFFECDQQFLLFRNAELDKVNKSHRRQTRNSSKGENSESLQNSDRHGGDARRDSRGQLRDSVYWRKRKRNNSSARRSRLAKEAKEIEYEIRLKYIKLLVETARLHGMF